MLLVDKIAQVSKVAPVDKKASKEELKERALAKALDYELALWCVEVLRCWEVDAPANQ
jgi:hypothetical protein